MVGVGVVKHRAMDLVGAVAIREIDRRLARRTDRHHLHGGRRRGAGQLGRKDLTDGVRSPRQVEERIRARLVDRRREVQIGGGDGRGLDRILDPVVVHVDVDGDATETALTDAAEAVAVGIEERRASNRVGHGLEVAEGDPRPGLAVEHRDRHHATGMVGGGEARLENFADLVSAVGDAGDRVASGLIGRGDRLVDVERGIAVEIGVDDPPRQRSVGNVDKAVGICVAVNGARDRPGGGEQGEEVSRVSATDRHIDRGTGRLADRRHPARIEILGDSLRAGGHAGERVASAGISDRDRIGRALDAVAVEIEIERGPDGAAFPGVGQAVAVGVVPDDSSDRADSLAVAEAHPGRGGTAELEKRSCLGERIGRHPVSWSDLADGDRAVGDAGEGVSARGIGERGRLGGTGDPVAVGVDEHLPSGEARFTGGLAAVAVDVVEHEAADRSRRRHQIEEVDGVGTSEGHIDPTRGGAVGGIGPSGRHDFADRVAAGVDASERIAAGGIGEPGRLAGIDHAVGVEVDKHRPAGQRRLTRSRQSVTIEVVANGPLNRPHLGDEVAEIGGRGRARGDGHRPTVGRADEGKQAADGGAKTTSGDLEHGHRARVHPGDPVAAVGSGRCGRFPGVRNRVAIRVDEHRPTGDPGLTSLASAVLVAVFEHRPRHGAGDRGKRHVREACPLFPSVADPHGLPIREPGRRREACRYDLDKVDVAGGQSGDREPPVDVGDGTPFAGVEDAVVVGVDEHRPASEAVLGRIIDAVAVGVVEDISRDAADEHFSRLESLELERPAAAGDR